MKPANSTSIFVLCALVATLAGGCNCGSGGDDEVDDDAGTGEPSIASSRAKMRFKDGARMQNDLASILELEADEVCAELGQYDCVGEIHTISLLGTEPHGLGFYEPLKETAVTTPLAVERVVISACSTRVDRDFEASATPVIFKNLPVTGGAITDTADPAVAEAIDLLYRRAMQRHATAAEIEHLVGFYDDVVASGAAANPAESWAKGACFAVLTTLETLFY